MPNLLAMSKAEEGKRFLWPDQELWSLKSWGCAPRDINNIGDIPLVGILECLLDTRLGSETGLGMSGTVPPPNTRPVSGESSGFESSRFHMPSCRVEFKALPLSKGNGKESTAKKKRETEDTNLLRLH